MKEEFIGLYRIRNAVVSIYKYAIGYKIVSERGHSYHSNIVPKNAIKIENMT